MSRGRPELRRAAERGFVRGPAQWAAALGIAALAAHWAWISYRDIIEVNDFECFRVAAAEAWQRKDTIYYVRTIEGRSIENYSPAAAILMIPLAWVPVKMAAVLFTFLKLAALGVFVAGSLRFAGASVAERGRMLVLAAAALLTVYRPIDNDFGNGQVNVLAAALAAAGVWLLMSQRKIGWIGAVPLAMAVALKSTPALLLAVPLLHGRWGRFAAAAAACVLLLQAAPRLWFGNEAFERLAASHRARISETMLGPKDMELQLSLHQVVVFTLAQVRAPEGLFFRNHQIYRREAGHSVEADIPDPMSANAAERLWLAEGILIGIGYLIARWLLFGPGRPPWPWDLAVLFLLSVMASPLARKAHLVAMIPAAAFMLAAFAAEWNSAAGLRGLARARPAALAVFAMLALALLIADDLPLAAPGFVMPYFIAPFFALILALIALALLRASSSPEEIGENDKSP